MLSVLPEIGLSRQTQVSLEPVSLQPLVVPQNDARFGCGWLLARAILGSTDGPWARNMHSVAAPRKGQRFFD